MYTILNLTPFLACRESIDTMQPSTMLAGIACICVINYLQLRAICRLYNISATFIFVILHKKDLIDHSSLGG